jgi:hypothetical protein
MPCNEELDARIRSLTVPWERRGSRRMFGGVCHMVDGRMFAGVLGDSLILRLGEKGAAEALRSPHVRSLDITGRSMRGWVMVSPKGIGDDESLVAWLEEARDFALTVPKR